MQGLLIFVAIFIGLCFPKASAWTFLIRPNLMIMLFFAFLGVHFQKKLLHRKHFIVLLFNLILPICCWWILRHINEDLATGIFLIVLAPAAAAAPVIAEFFKAKVDFVTICTLMNTLVVATVLPFMLLLLNINQQDIDLVKLCLPVFTLVGYPLLGSLLLNYFFKKLSTRILQFKKVGFFLFLFNVMVAGANASQFFLANEAASYQMLGLFSVVTIIACLLNFKIGEWIGGKELKMECGLGLGRKNTMFMIWVALTYFNPVVAIIPMMYILFQNIYNSWQLWELDRKVD